MSGEVPDGWEATTLAAACDFFTDGDWVESKDQNPDGEVRLIQLADIGDGLFQDKSSRFLTAEKARELRCSMLETNDLLIARMADPIARCCLFPGLDQPAATVVDVAIARAREGVDQRFLSYAVSNRPFRELALGAASGTTRSRISRSNLGALPILLPRLDEQRQIAEVLRSVDDAISAVRGVAVTGEQALNAHVEHFVGGFAGEPREIGSFATFVGSGVTPKGGKAAYKEGGIPFIRSQNVHFGELRMQDIAFIDEQTDRNMARTRVQPRDVLLNITGASIGRCVAVPTDFQRGNVNQHVCIIRPNQSVLPEYLAIFLGSREGQRQIDQLQGGLSREGLNFQQVRAVSLSVPDVEVQQEFVSEVSSFRAAVAESKHCLRLLNRTKAQLSADLLSGRVRVPA